MAKVMTFGAKFPHYLPEIETYVNVFTKPTGLWVSTLPTRDWNLQIIRQRQWRKWKFPHYLPEIETQNQWNGCGAKRRFHTTYQRLKPFTIKSGLLNLTQAFPHYLPEIETGWAVLMLAVVCFAFPHYLAEIETPFLQLLNIHTPPFPHYLPEIETNCTSVYGKSIHTVSTLPTRDWNQLLKQY